MQKAWAVLIVLIVAYVECLPKVSRLSPPAKFTCLRRIARPLLRYYGGQSIDEDNSEEISSFSEEDAQNASTVQEVAAPVPLYDDCCSCTQDVSGTIL